MLWWIVAPGTISAHDVSVKILRRFPAEYSCPQIFKKRRAVLILGSLAHLVSYLVFSSCCIHILLSFCFPPASLLFIRRFRFPVCFCVLERSQNEGRNNGKIHDKQLGMNLARSWQTFFPILLLLRQLPLPLRGLVFVFPAPAKHQQHQHHRDCCCCWCWWCWCWYWCWCW